MERLKIIMVIGLSIVLWTLFCCFVIARFVDIKFGGLISMFGGVFVWAASTQFAFNRWYR